MKMKMQCNVDAMFFLDNAQNTSVEAQMTTYNIPCSRNANMAVKKGVDAPIA
jgi:hypothetical protein